MHDAGKAAITVELGGRCRSLPAESARIAATFAAAFTNVLRHYGMLAGAAEYEPRWLNGFQHAVLAGHSGLYSAEPGVEFQQPVPKGTPLARIRNLYGDELEVIRAPVDGRVFGLRSLNTVETGDWCCFFAEIETEIAELQRGAGR
jgi:predicted deacylase